MILDLKLSEFNISGESIPELVADKILEFHITPLQDVIDNMTVCVFVSENSGYRSVKWEKEHNRSGSSQHVFKGKGAVDLTCDDFPHNKDRLLELLIQHTEYTRFCVYNSFIHADYKPTTDDKRQLFHYGVVRKEWKWIFDKFI